MQISGRPVYRKNHAKHFKRSKVQWPSVLVCSEGNRFTTRPSEGLFT